MSSLSIAGRSNRVDCGRPHRYVAPAPDCIAGVEAWSNPASARTFGLREHPLAYILGEQRDGDGREALRRWNQYKAYLRRNKGRFPRNAYELATSDWYFGFSDHRAPHDARLEAAVFEASAEGNRKQRRVLSLRVTLVAACDDMTLEFWYPRVFSYSMVNSRADRGHGDWRYDEFRVNRAGHLLHEIEWAGPPGADARWLIEASDVLFAARSRIDA